MAVPARLLPANDTRAPHHDTDTDIHLCIPACYQGTFQGALVGWLDPGGHQLICPPLLSAAQGLTLFFLGMTCTSKKGSSEGKTIFFGFGQEKRRGFLV
jgi:hypothetical protein